MNNNDFYNDKTEIKCEPSTERIKILRERYLSEPLMIDAEYIKYYTEAHNRTDGMNVLQRRAECHSFAMENLTPVIGENDIIVGNKTRYVRGAIPYCNYASRYLIREFKNEEAEAQDKVTDIGEGGGIAKAKELASTGKYEFFCKKYILTKEDKETIKDSAEYFVGKSMQDVGDSLWKNIFSNAKYIEKGWQAGLYTAPHDPAPEGRYVLDYETALNQGFYHLIDRMKNKIAEYEITNYESAEKVYFWKAGIRILESVLKWADNYSGKAHELAVKEKDSKRKKELIEIADRCKHSPANSPRNFKEAIQAYWLIYLAGHIEGAHLGYSPGRFDRYMYPFYKKDKDAGLITDEEVLELLEALRIKMTELEYVASFSWAGLGSGNLFQNMIIGGLDEMGRKGDNELSKLIVQSAINCQTTQPTLSIWYDDSLSEDFLLKAAECVKTGCGFPAWFNLKVYVQHETEKSKLPESLIRKYAAMGGCTEPTMEGMSYGIVQAGFINHGKLFELAIYGGIDPRTGIKFDDSKIPENYNELLEAYKFHLKNSISNWQRYWNIVMAAHRQTCNLIYSSVLIRDCIERGKSLDDGGAVVNGTPTTLSSGLVNIVNSLAVVKKLVDEEKYVTMNEIRNACSKNWKGFESLHKKVMDVPKWGNNNDEVDSIYQHLFEVYCGFVSAQKNYLGEPYDPSMLAISTHAPFGKVCGATPDGRYEGETLCDGVTSPFPGTDKNGPLAVLLSAGKIDHSKIRGGLHNMKFHPSALRGIQGSKKLISLIKTYFESPGFQLQFNVVDSNMLKDAQQHPENYRDLIVRVAGFSAFFVELGKTIQDEIIRRTEHTL